jgi:hypothetical protein
MQPIRPSSVYWACRTGGFLVMRSAARRVVGTSSMIRDEGLCALRCGTALTYRRVRCRLYVVPRCTACCYAVLRVCVAHDPAPLWQLDMIQGRLDRFAPEVQHRASTVWRSCRASSVQRPAPGVLLLRPRFHLVLLAGFSAESRGSESLLAPWSPNNSKIG